MIWAEDFFGDFRTPDAIDEARSAAKRRECVFEIVPLPRLMSPRLLGKPKCFISHGSELVMEIRTPQQ
jgi:hypothetical protein